MSCKKTLEEKKLSISSEGEFSCMPLRVPFELGEVRVRDSKRVKKGDIY